MVIIYLSNAKNKEKPYNIDFIFAYYCSFKLLLLYFYDENILFICLVY